MREVLNEEFMMIEEYQASVTLIAEAGERKIEGSWILKPRGSMLARGRLYR